MITEKLGSCAAARRHGSLEGHGRCRAEPTSGGGFVLSAFRPLMRHLRRKPQADALRQAIGVEAEREIGKQPCPVA